MPLPKRKRSRSPSEDRDVLSKILRSVESFDKRLQKIENKGRSSRRRSRSMWYRRRRDRSGSYRSSVSSNRRSSHRVRRRIVSSSSSDSDSSQSRSGCQNKQEREIAQQQRSRSRSPDLVDLRENPIDGEHVIPEHDVRPIIVDMGQNSEVQVPQNNDLLSLLGDEGTVPTLFAAPLHIDIASRWDVILRKGLDPDQRAEVVQRYAPPENCKNIVPPKLNLQVKGALSESNERRDGRLANLQKQVGAGVAAIGKVLSSLYQKGEEGDKENIRALSDAGRLLADVHYQETMSRRDLVLLNINKDLKDTLSNSPPDEWLFGSNLEEAIKAKKTIDISCQQLKTKKVVKKPSQLAVAKNLNYNRPFRSNRGAYRSGQQSRQAPRSKTQYQFRKKQDQWRSRDMRQ